MNATSRRVNESSAATDPAVREALLIEEEFRRRDWQRHYPEFFRAAWPILEPNTALRWNWHHDLVCEYLQAVRDGEITRLVINIAPRTTKSLLTTVLFPDWVWTTEPHARFLCGSYAADLATKHSILRRNVIEADWYRSNWGDRVALTSDSNQKTEFSNTRSGFMKASGIKAPPTGSGSDYILIDDPLNPKQAESTAERESALEQFDLGWSNRLNDKKTGRIVIIMQRLHENDLTGHVLGKNLGYVHLKIPTVCETPTRIVFPKSGRVVERAPGDLLHPERDGQAEVDRERTSLGSYGFAGQHQQAPVPREGAMIKRAWLTKTYRELPARFDALLQSWDLAFRGTERSDFVVGLILGRAGGDYYLFPDLVRARMNFPETLVAFEALSGKHPQVVRKVVEAKANGAALIDTLKKKVTGIVPFNPRGTKEERLAAVSPVFEAGNFYLPDPSIAPWVKDYIDELTVFPKGTNDDQVDATSQGLAVLAQRVRTDWAPASMSGPSKWR